MINKLMILRTIILYILLTGCQTANRKNTVNFQESKQNKSQEKINNQNDFVTDDFNIEVASQIKVNASLRQLTNRKIKESVDEHTFTLNLYDNKTANDFWNQLPLSMLLGMN